MRRARTITAALALGLTLAACGSGTATPENAEPEGNGAASDPLTIRIGYIAGPAPASHMLLADEKGYFAERGITVEATPFTTGITLSQALTGGSVDIGVMGAVIANFPARGQGKVILLNNLEANIQQLWAAPGTGVESVADLAGKQVATTTGTAAHLLLQVALEAEGLSTDDVEIVNLDMPAVANTFVTGGVDAAALWAPFDQQIAEHLPDAVQLATSGDYEEAAIASGWVANNEFYEQHEEALPRIAEAWMDANADIVGDQEAALDVVCPRLEENMTIEVCKNVYAQTENFTNEEWATFYEDGTALGWVNRMEEFFVQTGALEEVTGAENYVDTSVFLQAAQ